MRGLKPHTYRAVCEKTRQIKKVGLFSNLPLTPATECDIIGAFYRKSYPQVIHSKLTPIIFNLGVDQSEKIRIIDIMKNEKKVEKTKATLVRELEAKLKVNKGFLDSLERANKETIVKLINL